MPLFRRKRKAEAKAEVEVEKAVGTTPYERWALGRSIVDTTAKETVSLATAISLPIVYRSIFAISDILISAPRRLVRSWGGQSSPLVDSESGAARALASMSFDDAELALIGMLGDGNGFLRVHRDAGVPVRLEGLPHWAVGVRRDVQGQLAYDYLPAYGARDSIKLRFPDIAHIRFRMVGGHDLGESPLVTCAESIGLAIAQRRFASDYLADGAGVFYSLSTDRQLTADQAPALNAAIERGLGRNRMTGRRGVMLLDRGMALTELGTGKTARDSQMVEAQVEAAKEMSRLFGIPLSFLGVPAQRSATAVEETRQLAMAVRPYGERFAEGLSAVLLTPEQRAVGWRVEIDLTRLTLGHGGELAEYTSRIVNAGLATPNEARRLLGLPPIPGGDDLRAPVNTLPVEQWRKPQAP